MNDDELQRMVRRVNRLERQNRLLTCGMGGAFVVVMLLGLMGQTSPGNKNAVFDTIETKKLTLLNMQGIPVGLLQAKSGATALTLWGPERSQTKFSLEVGKDFIGLGLHDRWGKERAGFFLEEKGSAVLTFSDINEDPRIALGQDSSDANPFLKLLGPARTARLSLVLAEKGVPGLGFLDGSGTVRASLALTGDHEAPSLTLYDQNGNDRAVLGHTKLEVKNSGTIEARSESSLVLFGKDSKVLWKAPPGP